MRKNIIAIIIKIMSSLILSAIFLFVCFNINLFNIYVSCGILILQGAAIVILLYDIISEFKLYYENKKEKIK
jgi:hypothetical protein